MVTEIDFIQGLGVQNVSDGDCEPQVIYETS